MQKVRIKIKVNEHIIEGTGELIDKKLTLKTNKEELEYDLKKSVFTKKNSELIIIMDFLNKKINYTLVNEKKTFTDNLTTFSLTNYNKQVMINYQIDNTSFFLEIKYETI